MRSGTLLLGPELDGVRGRGGDGARRRTVVGVSSGAAAIQLALEALGIGTGDEVIVPAFTAVPTVSAVCATGATPVPVDVDDRHGDSSTRVRAARRSRTARGRSSPSTCTDVPSTSRRWPSVGIPDRRGRCPGPRGDDDRTPVSVATAYSFYPTKNLGGIGDGGAVGTADPDLADADPAPANPRHDRAVRPRRREPELPDERTRSSVAPPAARSSSEAGTRRRREIARHYREVAPQLHWQTDHPDHVFHLCVARVSRPRRRTRPTRRSRRGDRSPLSAGDHAATGVPPISMARRARRPNGGRTNA